MTTWLYFVPESCQIHPLHHIQANIQLHQEQHKNLSLQFRLTRIIKILQMSFSFLQSVKYKVRPGPEGRDRSVWESDYRTEVQRGVLTVIYPIHFCLPWIIVIISYADHWVLRTATLLLNLIYGNDWHFPTRPEHFKEKCNDCSALNKMAFPNIHSVLILYYFRGEKWSCRADIELGYCRLNSLVTTTDLPAQAEWST